MEFLTEILGIGANVASGGLFGLLGSLLGVGAKYLQARQQAKAKQAEWDNAYKMRQLMMEQADRETENEIAIASSEGAWKGLAESYKTVVPAANVHMWVNDVRSLFRPMLTLVLWLIVIVELRWMLDGTLQAWIDAAGSFGPSIKYIVDSTVFSASTATVWWYGDRAMTPPGAKGR